MRLLTRFHSRLKTVLWGVILFGATPAFAEVCDKERPDWDGFPVGAFHEAWAFYLEPTGLSVLAVALCGIAFPQAWIAGIAAKLVAFITLLTIVERYAFANRVTKAAISEGCVGSPFMIIASLIALGAIVYAISIWRKSADVEKGLTWQTLCQFYLRPFDVEIFARPRQKFMV